MRLTLFLAALMCGFTSFATADDDRPGDRGRFQPPVSRDRHDADRDNRDRGPRGPGDLQSQIDDLRSQIKDLKAQLERNHRDRRGPPLANRGPDRGPRPPFADRDRDFRPPMHRDSSRRPPLMDRRDDRRDDDDRRHDGPDRGGPPRFERRRD